MLGENAVGILLAGGYGALRPGVSKLVESVSPTSEKPMICCVADVFKTLAMPMVVVVNDLYCDQLKKALHCCDHFVIQKERVGNGGAVRMCLPLIPLLEKYYAAPISTLVILYGDMPLWKPESIQMLITSHKATDAVISMFSINVKEGCPEMVGRYGRILKNRDGKIIGVREPYELTQEEIQSTSAVNPSAWVFHRGWLEENIVFLEPHNMDDGHPPEYWLPDLVSIASKKGHHVNEVPLEEFWQAMGVNTHKELEEVRVRWNQ